MAERTRLSREDRQQQAYSKTTRSFLDSRQQKGHNPARGSFRSPDTQSSRYNYRTYKSDYFCGTQAKIYFGDIWVDDIITIQYSTNQNKTPIYGYASEHYDAVAPGTVLVEGQMTIAFKEVGYLNVIHSLLNEQRINVERAKNNVTQRLKRGVPQEGRGSRALNDSATSKEPNKTSQSFVSAVNPNMTPSLVRREETIENILDTLKDAERGGANLDTTFNSNGQDTTGLFFNSRNDDKSIRDFEDIAEILEDSIWGDRNGRLVGSAYLDRLLRADEFDYTFQNGLPIGIKSWSRRTGYSDVLNILMTFGDINDFRAEHTLIALNDVHFRSQGMIVTPNGEPIAEMYSFFARDINRNSRNISASINPNVTGGATNPLKLFIGTDSAVDLARIEDIKAIEEVLDSRVGEIKIKFRSGFNNSTGKWETYNLEAFNPADVDILGYNFAINGAIGATQSLNQYILEAVRAVMLRKVSVPRPDRLALTVTVTDKGVIENGDHTFNYLLDRQGQVDIIDGTTLGLADYRIAAPASNEYQALNLVRREDFFTVPEDIIEPTRPTPPNKDVTNDTNERSDEEPKTQSNEHKKVDKEQVEEAPDLGSVEEQAVRQLTGKEASQLTAEELNAELADVTDENRDRVVRENLGVEREDNTGIIPEQLYNEAYEGAIAVGFSEREARRYARDQQRQAERAERQGERNARRAARENERRLEEARENQFVDSSRQDDSTEPVTSTPETQEAPQAPIVERRELPTNTERTDTTTGRQSVSDENIDYTSTPRYTTPSVPSTSVDSVQQSSTPIQQSSDQISSSTNTTEPVIGTREIFRRVIQDSQYGAQLNRIVNRVQSIDSSSTELVLPQSLEESVVSRILLDNTKKRNIFGRIAERGVGNIVERYTNKYDDSANASEKLGVIQEALEKLEDLRTGKFTGRLADYGITELTKVNPDEIPASIEVLKTAQQLADDPRSIGIGDILRTIDNIQRAGEPTQELLVELTGGDVSKTDQIVGLLEQFRQQAEEVGDIDVNDIYYRIDAVEEFLGLGSRIAEELPGIPTRALVDEQLEGLLNSLGDQSRATDQTDPFFSEEATRERIERFAQQDLAPLGTTDNPGFAQVGFNDVTGAEFFTEDRTQNTVDATDTLRNIGLEQSTIDALTTDNTQPVPAGAQIPESNRLLPNYRKTDAQRRLEEIISEREPFTSPAPGRELLPFESPSISTPGPDLPAAGIQGNIFITNNSEDHWNGLEWNEALGKPVPIHKGSYDPRRTSEAAIDYAYGAGSETRNDVRTGFTGEVIGLSNDGKGVFIQNSESGDILYRYHIVPTVNVGDTVEPGQLIGRMDSESHVHFTAYDRYGRPLNVDQVESILNTDLRQAGYEVRDGSSYWRQVNRDEIRKNQKISGIDPTDIVG